MNDTSRSRPLAETLAAMAALTPAQHALLERISHHASPVTVAELAQEAGLHVSSVRETLEGLFALGLVEKQQLPSSGRGRPALGYSTMPRRSSRARSSGVPGSVNGQAVSTTAIGSVSCGTDAKPMAFMNRRTLPR